MRKTHDPSEILLSFGGLAHRPASAAALVGLKFTTLASRIQKPGSSAPAERRTPPSDRRFSEKSGASHLRLPRDAATAFHSTTRFDKAVAHSASWRAGWILSCKHYPRRGYGGPARRAKRHAGVVVGLSRESVRWTGGGPAQPVMVQRPTRRPGSTGGHSAAQLDLPADERLAHARQSRI
jgi:hypothetical protein